MKVPEELRAEFRKTLLRFRNQAESNLGETDKGRKNSIDRALDELMHELEKKKQLDTTFSASRIGLLFDILRKVRDVALPYNFFIEMFSDENAKRKMLSAVQEFGIGEPEFIQWYLATYATACVLSTELFKLLVLFQIKGRHKVSAFSRVVPNLAPNSWRKLERFVNNEFRNGLAHGMYIVENGKAVLFDNSKLEVSKEMSFQDFIMEVKNQNILFWSALLKFLYRMENAF